MDRNGDGKLSWDEFKTRGATQAEFDATDADGDGFVSLNDVLKNEAA